ncbi:hypothetical protein QUA54_06685 [Microcoleus sp. MOSTC5]|uniref:hypothetical protein n=1 Tax=Microcoleus sp. MOSTC5 TaxID=3055378 RepID=UPI002FD466B5
MTCIFRLSYPKSATPQKDMPIAAIALSVGATVITSKQRDFCQVPRLSIEDGTLDS